MDQDQIDSLTLGEDTDLHKHDQRYYTETELDAIHALIDGELEFFNGTFLETFNALTTSNGSTVTMSLEQSGGGDLTMFFSSGRSILDCTPAATIALTAGTDSAPQANYVYIPESTKVLTKDTSGWPSEEHIKVAYLLVPSAALVQADGGPYINQNWNDHRKNTDDQGHLAHLCEAIRLTMDGARWHEGVGPNGDGGTYIVITGTPDELYFKSTAGVAFQMHKHTVAAWDMQSGDNCHVVNWNGDAYHAITDLASIVADSTGATLSNKYYNLTFWGTANKSGEHSPLMVNLPNGSYNLLDDAISDKDGYDVTTIPFEFTKESTIGFLICRLTFRFQAPDTFTLEHSVDLRGVPAGSSSGSSGSEGFITEFADNVFKIYDSDDVTKELTFDLAGITTGNTRTITPADADMTMLSTTQYNDLTDGGDTTLHGHGAYLLADGSQPLTGDWDVGTPLIKSDEIRSRLGTDTGLKLSNRGNTGFIFIEDGSEHVGINVADPDKVLDVYQSAGNIIAQFTTGAANCFLEFLDSSTGSNKVYLGAIGDDMVIFGDGTSAIRITTSGVLDVANSACVLDEDTLGTDSATQLATQQSIKAYIDNKSYLDLGSILTGDGAYVGTKMTVTVDDASTIFGDVLAQAADFNYDRADADAAANSVGLVMALSSGSGSKEVLIEGQVCETDWAWSAGLLYLSTTTGKMTQTAPSGTGDQVVAVGWALSADTIYFKPSLVLAEIA
jgi:hypothetical protein